MERFLIEFPAGYIGAAGVFAKGGRAIVPDQVPAKTAKALIESGAGRRVADPPLERRPAAATKKRETRRKR